MKRGFRGSRLLAAALFVFFGANTFAQLKFSNIEPLSAREARVRLTVPPATAARIDVSTNLFDWSGFLTVGAGSLVHTDTVAPSKFYRAEQVPTTTMTGDHFSTPEGDLVIRPVAHATFLMRWNGKMVYNDPTNVSYAAFPKADIILISHHHGDHFIPSILAGILAPEGKIIATQMVLSSMPTALRPSTTVLANGRSTNFHGIEILSVRAFNDTYHTPSGTCNGYVVTIGGKRIYISGDTGVLNETAALQNIDIAFVAMNNPFTITTTLAAANLVRAFQPKVVYPYHFRNQDGSFTSLNAFKSTVGTDLPIEVRLRKWY